MGINRDSSGNLRSFYKGDRVKLLQVPWRGTMGTVVRQILHYDCDETFWGNLVVDWDGGVRGTCNCWQVEWVSGRRRPNGAVNKVSQ